MLQADLVDLALAAELGLDRLDRSGSWTAPPQSPQPSQTASLMTTRVGRVGQRAALAAAALLGGAGLVVDRAPVTPGMLAQLALDRVELVAVAHRARRGARSALAGVLAGSSVTTTMLAHALGLAAGGCSCGTLRSPSTGWPPVIATASLKRIL